MTDPVVNESVATEHGLTREEFQQICQRLGRQPSWTELGMLSVMWSEHCSYKSTRVHLRKFSSEGERVLCGPGENAGVVAIDDQLAVSFKIESHNHPSFIEPYQGAATGVGGILRDVFTMGARPVANLNSLRFGRLDEARMRYLVRGVVAGIGDYGNCVGVPTVGGEVDFHPSYQGNILVNAMTVGVVRRDRIFRSAACGVGNPVLYVGSRTGRDGIHGATMASEEFSEDGASKRPRVQVGDPFTEKCLLEACLELMERDVLVAIQDMGAAGLTSSSCEMAARGGMGIRLRVDDVPVREVGMSAYEVMLSETQERMLMVVRQGGDDVVHEIFARWGLSSAVIGEVTETPRVVVEHEGRTVADLPVSILADEAPQYRRPSRAPAATTRKEVPADSVSSSSSPEEQLLWLFRHPGLGSKHWVYEQFDWNVRGSTARGPGDAAAAIVRVPDEDLRPNYAERRGLAMTVCGNGRRVAIDPRLGASCAVIEAAQNLACVGAEPLGVTDCLNFGNPETPEEMWTIEEAIEGISDACRRLGVPVVSGNVSLYNETNGKPILPTPTIGMVGLVEDVGPVPGRGYQAPGHRIGLLGEATSLGRAGSMLSEHEPDSSGDGELKVDWASIERHLRCATEMARTGHVASMVDVARGGLGIALAQGCLRGAGLGCRVSIGAWRSVLFCEGPGVYVLSAAEEAWPVLERIARSHGAALADIGVVTSTGFAVEGAWDLETAALKAAWESALGSSVDPIPESDAAL